MLKKLLLVFVVLMTVVAPVALLWKYAGISESGQENIAEMGQWISVFVFDPAKAYLANIGAKALTYAENNPSGAIGWILAIVAAFFYYKDRRRVRYYKKYAEEGLIRRGTVKTLSRENNALIAKVRALTDEVCQVKKQALEQAAKYDEVRHKTDRKHQEELVALKEKFNALMKEMKQKVESLQSEARDKTQETRRHQRYLRKALDILHVSQINLVKKAEKHDRQVAAQEVRGILGLLIGFLPNFLLPGFLKRKKQVALMENMLNDPDAQDILAKLPAKDMPESSRKMERVG